MNKIEEKKIESALFFVDSKLSQYDGLIQNTSKYRHSLLPCRCKYANMANIVSKVEI